MKYEEKIELFKDKLDAMPEKMEEVVTKAKELPTENIESLLHIKSIIRHMMRNL